MICYLTLRFFVGSEDGLHVATSSSFVLSFEDLVRLVVVCDVDFTVVVVDLKVALSLRCTVGLPG